MISLIFVFCFVAIIINEFVVQRKHIRILTTLIFVFFCIFLAFQIALRIGETLSLTSNSYVISQIAGELKILSKENKLEDVTKKLDDLEEHSTIYLIDPHKLMLFLDGIKSCQKRKNNSN